MLDDRNIVMKSNRLTEMRNCNYTLAEQRLLAVYLSRINPKKPQVTTVTFTMDEFQKILGLGKLNVEYWRNAFESLITKTITFESQLDGKMSWTTAVVFQSITFSMGERISENLVHLNASDAVLPLMFDLKKNYTKYQLWNCLRLSSSNQIRMYELLKQYEHVGIRVIPIIDLKEMLGLSDSSYPTWERFKTRILESCRKALAENTDICFEYEPQKTGRKFTSIQFYIYRNKDYVDQLCLDEFLEKQPVTELAYDEFIDPASQIELLCQAVNREFSHEEMSMIESILCALPLQHQYGIGAARYHYLSEKYSYLNVMEKRQIIHDRFKYLCSIL